MYDLERELDVKDILFRSFSLQCLYVFLFYIKLDDKLRHTENIMDNNLEIIVEKLEYKNLAVFLFKIMF